MAILQSVHPPVYIDECLGCSHLLNSAAMNIVIEVLFASMFLHSFAKDDVLVYVV